MKQLFSKLWKGSKQPRKQRKFIHNSPIHVKRKFLSATLNKELRKKYQTRNVEVRKGDEVKVMRGKFKKRTGKIASVDSKKIRVSIEGLQTSKKDGTKIPAWLHPSKIKIIALENSDKRRFKRKEKPEEKKQESESIKQEKENNVHKKK